MLHFLRDNTFKKDQSSNTQPPNIISNVESDQDTEEEQTEEEENEEEEYVELNGMWDFILPNEEQQEALPVSTRRKKTTEATQPNQQQNNSMPAKYKTVSKNSNSKVTKTSHVTSDTPPT